MSIAMSRKVEGLEAGAKRRAKAPKGSPNKTGPKPKAAAGVVQGGDGGAAPTHNPSPHHRDNALVCLTNRDLLDRDARAFHAFAQDACVPTQDPDDTAHLHRRRFPGAHPGGAGAPGELVFLTNGQVRQIKPHPAPVPRRYHPSQMTSRGVGFDSMYDLAYRVGMALQDQGVELGWRPVVSGRSAAEHDRARALAGLNRDQSRDRLRPRLREDDEADEQRAIRRETTALLRAQRLGDGEGYARALERVTALDKIAAAAAVTDSHDAAHERLVACGVNPSDQPPKWGGDMASCEGCGQRTPTLISDGMTLCSVCAEREYQAS